ncbi:MAG: methyltransferase [Pseudomonadales bacterium]
MARRAHTRPGHSPISAVCFAGLGDLAARELTPLIETEVKRTRIRNYDHLSFGVRAENLPLLRELRIVEDVLIDLGRLSKIERSADLARLGAIVSRDAVLAAVQAKNRFDDRRSGSRKTTTFACFVKQDKDRNLRRSEVSSKVEMLVAQQFPRWRCHDPAQLEIWVFWSGPATFAVRLTDEAFKYRGMKPPQREAALRPTIAAAMVAVANPREDEIVLDPMCGTGTLLLEGLAFNARAKFIGSDVSHDAIALAESRLGDQATLRIADALESLHDDSVDCILCNLPWGHQYAASESLYRDLIGNFKRTLQPSGRMVLLTDQAQMLESGFADSGVEWSREARVLVRGKWANIYKAHLRD